MVVELEAIQVEIPEGCNIIIGQSHFIKTVEDLYEALATTVPRAKFAIAFCEASGDRLVRFAGNDEELEKRACEIAMKLACGHVFVILLKDAYPINVLEKLKRVDEVCTIYCATANKLQVIVAKTEQGRGLACVIDGEPPVGIENEEKKRERKEFLRKIGYKFESSLSWSLRVV